MHWMCNEYTTRKCEMFGSTFFTRATTQLLNQMKSIDFLGEALKVYNNIITKMKQTHA